MQRERLLTVRRSPRAVPFSQTPVPRWAEPPPTRNLQHLDALVDDFFESPRASKKEGAREILQLMLHACYAEGQPFGGWWPSRGCIEVYTYGPLGLGWGDATALRCVGSFFRYAFERDALSASELLWLLSGLEEARRGRGYAPQVIQLPDTSEFHEARLTWAICEATRLAGKAGRATGQSAEATQEMVEPLCLAAVMLAAEDGVPVRFEQLEPEAYRERALRHTQSRGRRDVVRYVDSRMLPTLAFALERLTHAYAIHPERAAELAAGLRLLASCAAAS